ncbi:hypothetical protein GN956_G15512 [Arapaima gigas]
MISCQLRCHLETSGQEEIFCPEQKVPPKIENVLELWQFSLMAQNQQLVTEGSHVDHGQIKTPQGPVLPNFSSRTLHHPSFQSFYVAVGSVQCSREALRQRQVGFPVPAMIPSDYFYVDPAQAPGQRISNSVSQLEVFECCQLNTPRPIMSTGVAPSFHTDPFRREPHLVRDLGSQTRSWDPTCPPTPSASPLALRERIEVIQLSMEEDQAITNLLKLHYSNHDTPGDLLIVEDGEIRHVRPDTNSLERGSKGNSPGKDEAAQSSMGKELTAVASLNVDHDVKPQLTELVYTQADRLLHGANAPLGEKDHQDTLSSEDTQPQRQSCDVEQWQLRDGVQSGPEGDVLS